MKSAEIKKSKPFEVLKNGLRVRYDFDGIRFCYDSICHEFVVINESENENFRSDNPELAFSYWESRVSTEGRRKIRKYKKLN